MSFSDIAAISRQSPMTKNPIAQALAIQQRREEFGLTVGEIAKQLGVERSTVAHCLRLLALTPIVRKMVEEGRIKPGQARALVSLPAEDQVRLGRYCVATHATARKVEAMARAARQGQPSMSASDPNVAHLETSLSQMLGCPIKINAEAKTLTVEYQNLDVLDGILEQIGYSDD
jgi:ParB family chromosome partitioning protein